MSKAGDRPRLLLVSESWLDTPTELAFVTRSVAGAASRAADVKVVVKAATKEVTADGCFDLLGAGTESSRSGWQPRPQDDLWGGDLNPHVVVVDHPSLLETSWLARWAAHARSVAAHPERGLRFIPTIEADKPIEGIGVQVPVNRLAEGHRHNGLGFTDYILVLSDRVSGEPTTPPTPYAGWLTAAFHDIYVVVIENATAAVWRGRALRGQVSVDTRMDLWRLLAHARVTIDLSPGPVIARECIESLRLGTPIAVPADSPAAAHASIGGGAFSNVQELIECVDRVSDPLLRSDMADAGRRYAELAYGSGERFANDVERLLLTLG